MVAGLCALRVKLHAMVDSGAGPNLTEVPDGSALTEIRARLFDRSWHGRLRETARFLGFLVGIGTKAEPDGFGESLWDDARYLMRFRSCRQMRVAWRKPTWAHAKEDDNHPLLGRFGDDSFAEAIVDSRRWLVRERDWYGWPDSPRYAFFAMKGDDVWCAADFNHWPGLWQAPEG